ncbi:MAG TPA: isoamylase early set domain-containing protein [Polyangia bacterium]
MTKTPKTPKTPSRAVFSDDEPIAGLRALKHVEPPPSLVPAVMRAISEPKPVSFWQWLLKPRRLELRVTPVGLLATGAVAALALYAVTAAPGGRGRETQIASVAQSESTARPAPSTAAATGEVVQVRFVLVAKGAKKVSIAGDFNGWNAEGTVLENADGQGTFVATVPLRRGAHEYMFLVDGQWLTDPAASETRPDGFGRSNAVLRL